MARSPENGRTSKPAKPENLEEVLRKTQPIWKRLLPTRFARRLLSLLDMAGGLAVRTYLGARLIGLIARARPVLCADCFKDRGLRLDASRVGIVNALPCPNCGAAKSRKLTRYLLEVLAWNFFVRGSTHRTKYGAAPLLAFNEQHYGKGTYQGPKWLRQDVELIQKKSRIGFFHYGPRMWMIGDIEPLEALQDPARRDDTIQRILSKYPVIRFGRDSTLYRLRLNPATPIESCEYDSPPDHLLGRGRLDAQDQPVLYCAQDIEGCVHECRVTVEDELYIATLHPTKALELLDLTELLLEEDTTEFESLDLAVHMLFYATEHSYPISRAIAIAAMKSGFDGIVYPSYFSQVRSGLIPAETVGYGISIRHAARHFPRLTGRAKSGVYPNVALFGRPVRDGLVEIACINRLILHKVSYDIRFGPVVTR